MKYLLLSILTLVLLINAYTPEQNKALQNELDKADAITRSMKWRGMIRKINTQYYIPDYPHDYCGHISKDSLWVMTMNHICLLYTSPSPRDGLLSRMPSSA